MSEIPGSGSKMSTSRIKIAFVLVTALLGWFGILLQLYLILSQQNSEISFWNRFFNFFSYFTILTNVLVAICLTFTLLNSPSKTGRFFSNPAVHSAAAMYIFIVGTIYFFVLQKLWRPQGLQWLADIILHYIVPVLYTIYWLIFVEKRKLRWIHSLAWLIYPAVYFSYSLVRGAIVNWYPYPFIDVHSLGYADTFKNAIILLAILVIAGLLFIGVGKFVAPATNKNGLRS